MHLGIKLWDWCSVLQLTPFQKPRDFLLHFREYQSALVQSQAKHFAHAPWTSKLGRELRFFGVR